ncbi:MAG: hypothetical protein NZM40_02625 [Sphingomonadaceae bacterium]|uniref:FAD-binding domain-containing protein n=1 Tax=Thermaurantiacus sp. TaxID=2820283 RepID=UPI00298EFCED|nr:FAD-binding domain-containing protein [Thermaurantiacus sp.]MCS6986319.1 hypothetical protein [Sphingomonadaceae bacterium]MDW8414419.1 FAD-binding domain-containing protein [Thermaurantiacus sp.]
MHASLPHELPAFPATRAEALARLHAFLPNAGQAYARHRNLDEGPGARTHVSGLSPAIRRRLLTEEEVARAAVQAHGLAAARKFVEELCWRTYFRGHLEQRPELWRRFLAAARQAERELDAQPDLARRYEHALAGRTGIDAFDFWVEELKATGYLHNHARMCFASIWIFTLRLPWALGAALFFRHLLDACPAANTLSWRWVAGLHTPGKTYRADAAIIRRTSLGRFRVTAPLAARAAPLPPEPPAPCVPLPRWPEPDPERRTGLFLHTEDLSPETMPWSLRFAVAAATDRIGGDPSALKRRHAEAGLADACRRAAEQFGIDVERLPEDRLEEAMVDFAGRHGLWQIVTPHAAVGPVADRLERIAEALAARGVPLVRVLRAWDRRAWPHATGGFFAFARHIPELLAP